MAETVEDISKPEVEELEGDSNVEHGSTVETAAVAEVSAAGDDGSVAKDSDPSEPAAVDSMSTEEQKPESDAAEAATVSEVDAAGDSAVDAAAANDVDSTSTEEEKHVSDAAEAATVSGVDEAGDSAVDAAAANAVAVDENTVGGDSAAAFAANEDVAVELPEAAETDKNEEVAVPVAEETVAAPVTVEEKPGGSDEADAEDSSDATTDRVEHVTSKADKVTLSVEMPKAAEVVESVEANSVDAAAVETKSETSDSGIGQSKTTQDVMNMAGNDELKFGVLIGLVRVGQLSNKDVVDSVLCLVSNL